MTPSRPYKCIRDIVDEHGVTHKLYMTINLFDVDNFCECSNTLEGFKDDIKRTTVFLSDGKCFILRVAYKDFDALNMQIKEDYQMLDGRSMVPPDKVRYKGFIRTTGATKKNFMVVTFHRKDYELKGCTEKDFQEFAYHALFNYTYPMN